MNGTALVVGASVAGIRTAQALRAGGWRGRVVVVGDESSQPYDRPPLSKQMLTVRGEVRPTLLITEQEAAESGIELLLGVRAVGLDRSMKRVVLEDGRELSYDQLVIATGASARPSPWGQLPGLHVLRGLDDCLALRHALHEGDRTDHGHVVVVGAGFIGSEVAAAARALDVRVSLVDPMPAPLSRVLGPDVGGEFATLHHRHGVETHFGCGVVSVTRSGDRLRVLLDDGTHLSATSVVVGIGAKPNVEWLSGSGLTLGDGVVCDAEGRAVGGSDVSAVGDVACWTELDSGIPRRVEHWTRAVEQANHVGRRLCGAAVEHVEQSVEYVWSDLYDWKTQVIGRPTDGSRAETVGGFDGAKTKAAVLYVDAHGVLIGALTVNWPRAMLLLRRAIAQRSDVRAARDMIETPGRPGEAGSPGGLSDVPRPATTPLPVEPRGAPTRPRQG
jgi:phthalate 3,4-dioxygenase ferredoxin reductase subunit